MVNTEDRREPDAKCVVLRCSRSESMFLWRFWLLGFLQHRVSRRMTGRLSRSGMERLRDTLRLEIVALHR